MSSPVDRRTRKRLATRQAIADAATQLFDVRDFDQVTVDEIAAAADVGRMSVFNHFARKEDLFFDLYAAGRADLRACLHDRDPKIAPVEALRQFAHHAIATQQPYLRFFDGSARFIQTITQSQALMARARAIRDELATMVQQGLAETAGQALDDPMAHLAAQLLVTSWAVAFIQAHHTVRQTADAAAAERTFLTLVDQDSAGVNAAVQGTPYADLTN